jgi:hypothetical protein
VKILTSRRSAPASAGSRRSSASTRSASWPRSTSVSPARGAVPGCPATRVRSGWSRPSRRCATRRRSWRSCGGRWCSVGRLRSSGQARDLRGVGVRRYRGARGCGDHDVRTWRRRSAARSIPGAQRWSRWRRVRRQGVADRGAQRAAKNRGMSAADLVKGALRPRGGGNADLAQGGWSARRPGGKRWPRSGGEAVVEPRIGSPGEMLPCHGVGDWVLMWEGPASGSHSVTLTGSWQPPGSRRP